MSVFLAVTLGLTGAYYYDRRECERLKNEYMDKVKWMSELPLDSTEMSRKIRVYGARVPEDGELERSSKWFKRYMRVSATTCSLGGRKLTTHRLFDSQSLSRPGQTTY